jgi:hypothetical protein
MKSLLRIAAITLAMLAGIASLPAQTVIVTAQSFGGTVPFTGVISWQPTLANGTPASVQMASGGQTTTPPVTAYVLGGVFTLTLPATDLTNPKNLCFHVTAMLKGVNVLGPGYNCVQPHFTAQNSGDWCQAGVCNFDNYIPNLPALGAVVTGPQGPQGVQGLTGATGAAATADVGTTTTGAPGTNALVVNGGTTNAAVFNFTIPQGATGATGPPTTFTGAWNGPATYTVGQAVSYQGSSYVALVANSNVPPTPGATWGILALSAASTNTPPWLQYLGSGSQGAYNCSGTCSLSGQNYFSSFNVSGTLTIPLNSGLQVYVTGACSITGHINGRGLDYGGGNPWGAGAIGGSGGGTGAGAAGTPMHYTIAGAGYYGVSGGAAGAAAGGNGGNGGNMTATSANLMAMTGGGAALYAASGGIQSTGYGNVQSTSSGGGSNFVAVCSSITGAGGIIDVSGVPANPSTANNMGANGGGGGGAVVLSSQAPVTSWPTVYVAGGAGGLDTVPFAAFYSGTCTSPAKATLGVTSGALSSCTVVQAGAGCGTGTNVSFSILGGGGTGGTITPTWSGGALVSCTASGGSGYTATTYTNAGNGGDGGTGWFAEFQNW